MTVRSSRREVRNPVLALPGLKAILALPEPQRDAICDLLTSLRDDARGRAQQSWIKNKGPMAAYWKATGAYVEHIRRAVKRGPEAVLAAADGGSRPKRPGDGIINPSRGDEVGPTSQVTP